MFLADTGASLSTILDRDAMLLKIPTATLEPLSTPVVGIGGSVRAFIVRDVKFIFNSDNGTFTLQQNLCVVQHDLVKLPAPEISRILRVPSVIGRDILNRFHLSYNYQTGIVQLEN